MPSDLYCSVLPSLYILLVIGELAVLIARINGLTIQQPDVIKNHVHVASLQTFLLLVLNLSRLSDTDYQ